LASELAEAGFGPESTILLDSVLQRFKTWSHAEGAITPQTSGLRWLLQRLVSSGTDGSAWAAIDYAAAPDANLSALQSDHVFLADWSQTMRAVRDRPPRNWVLILLRAGRRSRRLY